MSGHDEEKEANAELIVKAVNNHAALVDALKSMCEWHEKQSTWDKGDNGYYKAKELLNSLNKS